MHAAAKHLDEAAAALSVCVEYDEAQSPDPTE